MQERAPYETSILIFLGGHPSAPVGCYGAKLVFNHNFYGTISEFQRSGYFVKHPLEQPDLINENHSKITN